MMKKINILVIILLGFLPMYLDAQIMNDTLTLEEAIGIALTNNYDLKIADNQLKQVQNSKTVGNAGLLPSVSLNGGAEYSNSDTELEFAGANSEVIKVDNAESMSYNGNVRVDYTLFGGLGNVYTYKKLKQNNERQQFVFQQQMENSILEVVDNYYQVARSQQNLSLAKESMKISKERYQKALDKKKYGQANRLDVLNAEVDMNSDSTNVLIAEQNMLTTVKSLNVALGIAVTNRYEVDEKVAFRIDLSEEKILSMALVNNSNLLAQVQQENISELDLKITQAQKYPSLNAYSAYGYSRQDNDAGQLLYNQNHGLTSGVTLKFNVFNGRQQHVKEQNARLTILSEQERTNQVKAQLERDASNAYTDYAYKKRIVDLQESSLQQARLNFEQTKEMFQLGRVTSIEFRTAQQNLLNVANNYNDARFNAKVSEYNLLRITGELVTEKQ